MELDAQIELATRSLQSGGVIAYPTEGVYGIGCDPLNTAALKRIVDIKQRDAAKGLILVTGDYLQLKEFIKPMQSQVEKRVLASWPGPVTWIVEANDQLPGLLTGGRDTLAVRVSLHPVIQRLTDAFGKPIVSTSANFSGETPAGNATEVRAKLAKDIDVVIDAPLGEQSGATPIFDALSGQQLR